LARRAIFCFKRSKVIVAAVCEFSAIREGFWRQGREAIPFFPQKGLSEWRAILLGFEGHMTFSDFPFFAHIHQHGESPIEAASPGLNRELPRGWAV
jgi:hypothetical protein